MGRMDAEMKEFKDSNLIPRSLMRRLAKHGIVTMDILCSEIQSKEDLKEKLAMTDKNECRLLWNIIKTQKSCDVEGVTATGTPGVTPRDGSIVQAMNAHFETNEVTPTWQLGDESPPALPDPSGSTLDNVDAKPLLRDIIAEYY